MHCPKGDDPLTVNQQNRAIQLQIAADSALAGMLYVGFGFDVAALSVDAVTDATCETAFQSMSSLDAVQCTVDSTDPMLLQLDVAILKFPTYPVDNNIFSHSGNPTLQQFRCDTSQLTSVNASCSFADIVADDVKGKPCSSRSFCLLQNSCVRNILSRSVDTASRV